MRLGRCPKMTFERRRNLFRGWSKISVVGMSRLRLVQTDIGGTRLVGLPESG